MRIILHEAQLNSLFGAVCSLVTLSAYSHASIMDNGGTRWDTTFKRGALGRAAPLSSEPDREIIVIDIPGVDPAEFLESNRGRPYDAWGLILWPFRKENPSKWYCFEAVNECLKSVDIELGLKKSISAKAILAGLLRLGYTAKITRGQYYERADN